MRRVLFINLLAPPFRNIGTDRILRFVRYMPEFGWRGDILSADGKKMAKKDASTLKRVPEETNIYRTKLIKLFLPLSAILKILPGPWHNYFASMFMIPDAFIGWYPFLRGKLQQLLSKKRGYYDIIVSSSPPHSMHLACLGLNKKFGIPWVVDFRDPWIDNPLITGVSNAHRKFYAFLERKVIENCDKVIANTEKNLEILYERYPEQAKKIVCVNNGYDAEDFKTNTLEKRKDYMEFFYGGSIHPAYDPEPLFYALELAIKKYPAIGKRVKFRFMGSKFKQNLVDKYKLRNVIIQEQIAYQDEFFTRLKNSDVAVVILNPLSKKARSDFWVPAKLYQYIGAEKPILAIVPDGDARKIVIESNIGYPCYPNEPEAIAQMIIKLFEMWSQDTLSSRVSSEVKKYEARYQAEVLVGLLNNLVKE